MSAIRNGGFTRPRTLTFRDRLAALVWVFTWTTLLLVPEAALPGQSCRVEIVEKGSRWPVPLVELRTTHHARFVTDNAGVIAFDLPELMGRETWFDVIGHGYEVPRDGQI